MTGPVPGPRSRELSDTLGSFEARGVTYRSADAPIFWDSASGSTVIDVDGNRYIDLTSAFGVASIGHSHPRVAAAIATQAAKLMHGMGDVHPTAPKAMLLQRLSNVTPIEGAKTFLASSGAEAVEFALKTAYLTTGGPDVLAFGGGYHGLSLGTLEITGNPKFRKPFQAQLRQTTTFVMFPDRQERESSARSLEIIERALKKERTIGAVIVEPIQGRAGVIVPPPGFLAGLRTLCSAADVVMIVDEIYTGFGRTGKLFASEYESVAPDIMCVGKAMSGGFPISAAIGTATVMDSWEPSTGEALHTSTFLGNPMGCAAALAAIDILVTERLSDRAFALGEKISAQLEALTHVPAVIDVRGRGCFWGIEVRDAAFAQRCVAQALELGVILLQSGLRGEVLTIAPPLVIDESELARALDIIAGTIRQTGSGL